VPCHLRLTSATLYHLYHLCHLCTAQQFVILTGHKPVGRRWVTKEQYIRYFMIAYSVVCPDMDMSPSEQRAALEVTSRRVVCCRNCSCLIVRTASMAERVGRGPSRPPRHDWAGVPQGSV
jgi:alpha-D-ribose 1-methylphosphonate 5-triphosphate diphosphatase PhnM